MSLATPMPGVKLISARTDALPRKEKFNYWNEVICRTVVDLDCQPLERNNFEASIEGFDAPGLGVYDIHTKAHLVYRKAAEISRLDSDAIIVNFVTSGTLLSEQDGRSVVLKPGDGAISDAARPYFLRFDDPLGCVSVKVYKSELGHRASAFERLTAQSMAAASSLNTMVFDYMSAMLRNVSSMDARASLKTADIFKQLLSASLDEMQNKSPMPLTEYRAVSLLRVKAYIDQYLGDSSMDAAFVATGLNLSVRYINKLFEAEKTSLMRYVWARRLECCAKKLKDERYAHLSISTIALGLGFNDLSHFSRAFSARFGLSPRTFRTGARLEHPLSSA